MKKNLWIFSFGIIIAMPSVFYFFLGKYLDSANYENRNMASRPILTMENYTEFPEEYENYYNDKIPFRNELIGINSAISYHVFQDSPSENIILGKDKSWLFYEPAMRTSVGNEKLSEEQLISIAQNIQQFQEYCNLCGVQFVLFIAPNKETVYMDELSEGYPILSDTTIGMQLTDYLLENTDVMVLWPYEELLEYKKQYYMYCHLDTHWNNAGAYVGAKVLATALGTGMPPLEDMVLEEVKYSEGDLTRQMHLKLEDSETDYLISGCVNGGNMCEQGANALEEYHNVGNDDRTVILRRDSFGVRLGGYLSSAFDDVYVPVQKSVFDIISEYDADIFVYEIVERNISGIHMDVAFVDSSIHIKNGNKIIQLNAMASEGFKYVMIEKKSELDGEYKEIRPVSELKQYEISVPMKESGEIRVTIYKDSEMGKVLGMEEIIY